MKRKISAIIIVMILCSSILVIVNNDVDVEANPGGGGDEEDNNNYLDYDYMWYNITEKLSNVIHDEEVYEEGEIPRGRTWGTDGDRWTAEYLNETMIKDIGLDNVQKLLIGYLSDYPCRKYSNKVEVNDFQITINNASHEDYPWAQQIPLSEIYVIPRAWPIVTWNYSYSNIKIKKLYDESENRAWPWPFAGTFNNYSLNLIETGMEYEMVIGNVSYINISKDETVPEEQYGMVFMIDDVEDETQERLDNMTNASGCIIIHDNADGPDHANTSNCYFSIAKVQDNVVNQDNLSQIINILENGTMINVDNVLENGDLTFTYNLDDNPYLPGFDKLFLFHEIRPNNVTGDYYKDYSRVKRASCFRFINPFIKGFFIYDSFNTYFMSYSMRDWRWVMLTVGISAVRIFILFRNIFQ